MKTFHASLQLYVMYMLMTPSEQHTGSMPQHMAWLNLWKKELLVFLSRGNWRPLQR